MPGRYDFPKRVRLLRSKDFRRVYDQGSRFSGPMFAAFCLRGALEDGPRIGVTVPTDDELAAGSRGRAIAP